MLQRYVSKNNWLDTQYTHDNYNKNNTMILDIWVLEKAIVSINNQAHYYLFCAI